MTPRYGLNVCSIFSAFTRSALQTSCSLFNAILMYNIDRDSEQEESDGPEAEGRGSRKVKAEEKNRIEKVRII